MSKLSWITTGMESARKEPGVKRPRTRIAGVVAISSVLVGLGVLGGVIVTAGATPPAGLTSELLGRGTTLGGFNIHVDGVKVSSGDAVDVAVAHLTFAPGGTTGWHVHPGPVMVIVTRGSVTKYSQDCSAQTYVAGQAFVEKGPKDENMVRNNGTLQAETIVTFIAPPGAPVRDDAPAPADCNP